MPYFIKIDVEGYEESVLNGLSTQPALLSFEFNTAFLGAAFRCLESAVFATDSMFNLAFGDPSGFELNGWVKRERIQSVMTEMKTAGRYGDIFVMNPALLAPCS